jgi:hypothetical protein
MEMGHLMQYIDKNQMISGVPMEILQSKESVSAKKISMKELCHMKYFYVSQGMAV